MTLQPGDRLGRYEVRGWFASGGMADLYLATASGAAGFEKTLLLKVLRPELAGQRKFVDLLADEARISARLDHECIVRVHDFAEAEGYRFLVLEYVPGLDLAKVLDRMDAAGTTVPEKFAAAIAARVARGLAYAHGMPDGAIVHRDVNPGNVALSRAGEVKILDFGIAKAKSRISRTEFGELKGKVLYMAPEQARGAEVDARTDLYALGMVLYEMLTGVPLLAGDSDLDVLRRARDPDFPPPSRYRPGLDPRLEEIVVRCLAPEPERRYASAGDLEDALDAWLLAAGGPVRAKDLAAWIAPMLDDDAVAVPPRDTAILRASRVARTPIGVGPSAWRKRWPLAVASVAVVVAVVFGFLSLRHGKPAADGSAPTPTTTRASAPREKTRGPAIVGTATVETGAPGALVFADGHYVARGPADVPTGNQTVGAVATLPGWREWTGRFKASPVKEREIKAPMFPAYAMLRLAPGTTARVDGKNAPAEDGLVFVRAGLRRIEVKGADGSRAERLIRFAPGETRDAEGNAVAVERPGPEGAADPR